MKTKLKLSVACGIAALLVGFNVQAEEKTFSIGGDLELDLTAKGGDVDTSYYHGGRVKLNAVGELKGDGYFIKGVAQPLVPFKGSSLGYDDVYLQMGRSNWDVQIGRFEGIDLFPVGKDTVLEAAAGLSHYGTNDARGRKDSVIHTAFHVTPNDAMKFELGLMAAKNTSDYDKYFAVRPAMTYKAGAVTVRAGLESVKNDAADTATTVIKEVSHTGYAIGAGFDVAGGTLNASYSKKNADKNDTDKTAVALNFVQGNWGVGYVAAKDDMAGNKDPDVGTLYAAYSVPLFGSKDASVTFAASTSKASNPDETINAARVRFNYNF